jgi:hypothetical protein
LGFLAAWIPSGVDIASLWGEDVNERAYAPQYGSAKDPINMADFVAGGLLRGEHPQVDVDGYWRLLLPSKRFYWTFARRRNLLLATYLEP